MTDYNAWFPSVGFHLYLLLGARKYFNNVHLWKDLEGTSSSSHLLPAWEGIYFLLGWGNQWEEFLIRKWGNLLKAGNVGNWAVNFSIHSSVCLCSSLFGSRGKSGGNSQQDVWGLHSFCHRCVNSHRESDQWIIISGCFPQATASLHRCLPMRSRTAEAKRGPCLL